MWNFIERICSEATFFDWLLLAAGILLVLYTVGTWNYDYFSRRGIPSTRPRIPFLGDMLPFFFGSDSFYNMLLKVYEESKGYSIYGNFEFQKPSFLIRDPELLKIISVKQFDHFMNNRQLSSAKADPLFNKNVFNLEGQQWRDMRTTLSPAFTTSKIKGMFPLISKCAQQMLEHIKREYDEKAVSDSNKGLETDMKNLFTRIGNDVIASVAFGVQCDSLKQPQNDFFNMGKLLTTFSFTRTLIFMGYVLFPKIMEVLGFTLLSPKAMSFFDLLVRETIQEREKRNIIRPDLLHLLMQARDGKLKAEKEDQHEAETLGNGKHEITNEDISAQAVLMFFAGFDTVSTALCFTSYQISHNPEVQRRLQQEVDEMWERTGGKPTYEDVQGMKYLNAVISEALRLHPPTIALDRECNEDATLPPTGNTPAITIRKGQIVNIPIAAFHVDSEFWPEPRRFDPERFNDDNKHKIKPFTYMPFGLGPRICLGQRFALMEVKLAMVYLVRNFNIQPSPKTQHPLEYERGINVSIKGGFWSYLTPRNL